MSGRRRRLALWAGAALLATGCAHGDSATDTIVDGSQVDRPVGGASASGYGAFEPLVGVDVVVEATVLGFRGPRAVVGDTGSVIYDGYVDDAAEWTTPLGQPVVSFEDVELVESIGGSDQEDALVEAALAAGTGVDVLTPVGVFEQPERYQLWLSARNQGDGVDFFTYLAFDSSGGPVVGLDLPNAEEAFARLVEYTGQNMTDSLVALAREMSSARAGAPNGELMKFVGLPDGSDEPSADQSNDRYPGTDEQQPGVQRVEIDVTIAGASPGAWYGLRGTKLLGWSATSDEGLAAVKGWVSAGERLELVRQIGPEGPIEAVAGAPDLVADHSSEPLLAFYQLAADGQITLESGLSLPELDALVRAELGLPPPEIDT